MSELLKNPQLLKRAQDEVRGVFDKKGNVDETGLHELKYLNSIVKETLRLHPPAPLSVPRESSEKCMVSGYEIPAKTKVIVNVWAIGRDPTYWTEGEKFDPERFIDSETDYKGRDFEYIPFGAGRRMVLEGGCARAYHLLSLIWSFHLHSCCTTSTGSSPMESNTKN